MAPGSHRPPGGAATPARGARLSPDLLHLRRAALLLLLLGWAGCAPPRHVDTGSPQPEPSPSPLSTPAATPEPSPTPLIIPNKRLDVGRLFNGIRLETSFATEQGKSAAVEVADPGSYSVHLAVTVRVPKAVSAPADLTALNPALPDLLPAFSTLLGSAKISPLYERFYRLKVNAVQQNLLRLDQLPPRHDFFDCETILELQAGPTHRKALLLQSDMDVDSDGSDSDRLTTADGRSLTFQPVTSYHWPKRTTNQNPFLPGRQAKLTELEGELAEASPGSAQKERLRAAVADLKAEITQLKNDSFLVGADDPFVVMSSSITGQRGNPFSPMVGDYCAVIYGDVIYPAVVGDVGPTTKMGEASLRIAQQINSRATSENRPESALKVTYLVFPGSAEHPFAPPNLDHWKSRVDALLNEIGGYHGQLFAWKDLTLPPPTPTPTPTPVPAPGTTPQPSPASSGTSSPVTTGSASSPALGGTATSSH